MRCFGIVLVGVLSLLAPGALLASGAHEDHEYEDEDHDLDEHQLEHEDHDELGAHEPALRLDLGFDLLFAAGASTANDEELEALMGGAHDPNKRGFTLQQAELSLRASLLAGGANPFDIDAQAFLVMRDDVIELEEAFATFKHGEVSADAGLFLNHVGLSNAQHPHQWRWLDQSALVTRFFGSEGLASEGVRLRWREAGGNFGLEVGMQNAYSSRTASFGSGFGGHHHEGEEEAESTGVGGRPLIERPVHALNDFLYSTRMFGGFEVGDGQHFDASATLLYGPNATALDGRTIIAGLGLRYRMEDHASEHGVPLFSADFEAVYRHYHAGDGFEADDDPVAPGPGIFFPSESFKDFGASLDVSLRVAKAWSVGLRAEYLSGSSASSFDHEAEAFVDREDDPARADRWRIASALTWHFADDARLVFQYSADSLDSLDDMPAHSFWIGMELFFGTGKHVHE